MECVDLRRIGGDGESSVPRWGCIVSSMQVKGRFCELKNML